jgi:hypothetical protein
MTADIARRQHRRSAIAARIFVMPAPQMPDPRQPLILAGGSQPVARSRSRRVGMGEMSLHAIPTKPARLGWSGSAPCVSRPLGPGWLVERSVPRRRPAATPPIQASASRRVSLPG